jgi:hypothetical protein
MADRLACRGRSSCRSSTAHVPARSRSPKRAAARSRNGRAAQQINWIARIEGAATKAELAAVGRQIKLVESTLQESARALIRTAYEDRLKELTQPATTAKSA